MRAIDWIQFLQEQRDKHGKVIFTLTELANVSSLNPDSLRMSLIMLSHQQHLNLPLLPPPCIITMPVGTIE